MKTSATFSLYAAELLLTALFLMPEITGRRTIEKIVRSWFRHAPAGGNR